MLSIKSGHKATDDTMEKWDELVKSNKSTLINLRLAFVLKFKEGLQIGVLTIPSGTEVSLFCNMKGAYKRPTNSSADESLGTFYMKGLDVTLLKSGKLRVHRRTMPQDPSES